MISATAPAPRASFLPRVAKRASASAKRAMRVSASVSDEAVRDPTRGTNEMKSSLAAAADGRTEASLPSVRARRRRHRVARSLLPSTPSRDARRRPQSMPPRFLTPRPPHPEPTRPSLPPRRRLVSRSPRS
jgi:hypothetical protein